MKEAGGMVILNRSTIFGFALTILLMLALAGLVTGSRPAANPQQISSRTSPIRMPRSGVTPPGRSGKEATPRRWDH